MTAYYVIPDAAHEPLTDAYETVLGNLPLAISKTQKQWFVALAHLFRGGKVSAECAVIAEFDFARRGWVWADAPEKNLKLTRWDES